MKRNVFAGIQTFCGEIGESACLTLCILKIIERIEPKAIEKFSVLDILQVCIDNGLIYYNWKDKRDSRNFYVEKPADIMELFVGGEWSYRHEVADYKPKEGEFVIRRWERVTPSGASNHFNLDDWDSIVDSETVRYGKVVSTRVLKRIR